MPPNPSVLPLFFDHLESSSYRCATCQHPNVSRHWQSATCHPLSQPQNCGHSAAYTPQQNDTVERANRTINEGVRALLLGGKMEDRLWAKVARTLRYAKNLLRRIQLHGKCPYEVFTGRAKPSLPHFSFGQEVVFWQPRVKREKLGPPGQRGQYLGSAMS